METSAEENLLEENSSAPPAPVGCGEKIKILLTVHWRGFIIFFTPIVFSFVLFAAMPIEGWQWSAYTLILMAVYWVVECIPLPVTAFIPVAVFPLVGVMDSDTATKCYMNDTLFMFLGSMILAYSIEQSGLHIRLALGAIRTVGYSHYKLLLSISLVTMFISMWITNTAATVMLVPIVFALLKVFEDQGLMKIYDKTEAGDDVASDLTVCYFCGVAYSATVGGIGTLVGTGTNLAFKGLFAKAYPAAPELLSFPLFSAFGVPMMICLQVFLYLCMVTVFFGFMRPNSSTAKAAILNEQAITAAKERVESDWKKLGSVTFWEIEVVLLFSFGMSLFFCRSPQIFVGWGDAIENYLQMKTKAFIKDSTAAFTVTFMMLLFPYTCEFFKNFTAKYKKDLPKKSIRAVLSWEIMNQVTPYSFMFLLGGGFCLSTASKVEYTDLNGKIGTILRKLSDLPNILIILILVVFTVFVTNFASNVAVCNVVAPIAMTMAHEIGYNPLWYDIACGFAASFCFCLPVGTPGNLVVQSAAKIPTSKMIKAGIGPTCTTIIITWLFVYFFAPIVWPELKTLPDWMQSGATTTPPPPAEG